jgi:hypothetical protein
MTNQKDRTERRITPSKLNKLFKEWADQNGCDECKNFMKRTIICSSNCFGKFFKQLNYA